MSPSAAALASRSYIGADAHLPDATCPGAPSNFSGMLPILNNDIDLSVKSGAQVLWCCSDAIRIVGSGSHLIAHDSIDCGWPGCAATGAHLFAQALRLPLRGRMIVAASY